MIAARPLTIAEIFDRTVTLVVRRWRIVLAMVGGAVAAVDYRNRSEGADLHAALDAPVRAW